MIQQDALSQLEAAVADAATRPAQDSSRLTAIADYCKNSLEELGLPGVRGGSGGELAVKGLARTKNWDVAYEFAGKFRLLISLKSIWRNIAGTVPNRLDDLMGEAANIQQVRPEIVIGYVLLFDKSQDRKRQDGLLWSEFFEAAVRRIAVRGAPLWNEGPAGRNMVYPLRLNVARRANDIGT